MIRLLDLLKKLDSWQLFTIVLFAIFIYLLFRFDIIGKVIKTKKQVSDSKTKDEIERIKDEFVERAFRNIEVFSHHAVENLEHCIGANYYVIHDSGNDLKHVKDWYLAVIRSTSFEVGIDYADPVLVNNGFRWFNENVRDKLFFCVDDAYNNENLKGIDGDYCMAMGIKSFAGCLVKNEGNVYHMISLNFDKENPKDYNPELRKVIFEFKRSVLSNIYK